MEVRGNRDEGEQSEVAAGISLCAVNSKQGTMHMGSLHCLHW